MNREQFKAICRKTQDELKVYLLSKLKRHYSKIKLTKDFLYAEGDIPICLVAHLDTVHKELPKIIIEEENKISSPQGIGGDDRCGVYAILQIIRKHKCSVLFCCDEEIGGMGAESFAKSKLGQDMNFYIELDRKGKTDAVFYECDNEEFNEWVTNFGPWDENYGSYTDICDIAPEKGCSAVNFSVGYYNQHTLNEYVVPSEVDYCIDSVCKFIEASKDVGRFKWVQAQYSYKGYYGNYDRNYYDKYEGYEDESIYLIQYSDEIGNISWDEFAGRSEYEAVGRFMMEHDTIKFCDVLDVIDEGIYAYGK